MPQILLTQDEYEALISKQFYNELVDKFTLCGGFVVKEFIGINCIHTNKSKVEYCDDCPLADMTSPQGALCTLHRNFSK